MLIRSTVQYETAKLNKFATTGPKSFWGEIGSRIVLREAKLVKITGCMTYTGQVGWAT